MMLGASAARAFDTRTHLCLHTAPFPVVSSPRTRIRQGGTRVQLRDPCAPHAEENLDLAKLGVIVVPALRLCVRFLNQVGLEVRGFRRTQIRSSLARLVLFLEVYAVVDQEFARLHPRVESGKMHRGIAELCLNVRFAALLVQEELHHLHMSIGRAHVEGRVSLHALRVHVERLLHKHPLCSASARTLGDQHGAARRASAWGATNQPLDVLDASVEALHVAVTGCSVQRRPPHPTSDDDNLAG